MRLPQTLSRTMPSISLSNIIHALALGAAVVASGCDGRRDETPKEAPKDAPEIGGENFDPIAALEGVWVIPHWRGEDPSKAPWRLRMLWEADGSVLTESNGVTAMGYDLKRLGPCLVKAKRHDKLVIDTGGSSPLKLVRRGTVWVEDKPGGVKPAKRYADKAAAMAELTGA